MFFFFLQYISFLVSVNGVFIFIVYNLISGKIVMYLEIKEIYEYFLYRIFYISLLMLLKVYRI